MTQSAAIKEIIQRVGGGWGGGGGGGWLENHNYQPFLKSESPEIP